MKYKLIRWLTLTTAFSSAFAPTIAKAEILLSSKIDKTQKLIIKNDLDFLQKIALEGNNSKAFNDFFATKNLDGKHLNKWLEDRVQVIVEENFLETANAQNLGPIAKANNKNGKTIANNQEIENVLHELNGKNLSDPKVFEELKLAGVNSQSNADSENGHTVMSNIGTAIYYYGKQQNVTIGLEIDLDDKSIVLPISSPRSGLIEIGPALFSKRFMIDTINTEAAVNKVNRLDTYLHEARHSDGNEKNGSLGFLHNNCPDFHDLKGMPACDFNGNGPYAVGGVFSYEYAKKCTDCNEEQRAALLARAYDSFSRVMREKGKLKIHDATHEGKRVEVK